MTRRGGRATGTDERGFTLVELIIAMMVLAIVMAALAPAFYGELKATAATDYRSTANGLAVAAIEQMRGIPYYEVGWKASDYTTTGSTALTCVSSSNTFQSGGTAPSWNKSAGLQPVELTTSTTLDNIFNLSTTQKIGTVTFTITRCVYWVAASTTTVTTYPGAYKLTWVGVSWNVGTTPWHITQTSAVYPGGEGPYQPPGFNNNAPAGATCAQSGTVPATPTGLTASNDQSDKTGTIDLTWSEGSNPPSVLPLSYEVDYSSNSAGPFTQFSDNTLLNENVDGLSAGTKYWFQVWAVACDDTPSALPATVSLTTNNGPQACSASNFSVTPATPAAGATIGSSDRLDQISSFTAVATVPPGCNNVALYYSPTNSTTFVTDFAPSGSGTLRWSTSATKWAAGTITFHLLIGGTDTGTTSQVTIACDAKKC